MVEVSPKRSEVKLSYRGCLLFLFIIFLLIAVTIWSLLGTQWGASNSWAEMFRRYLTVVNRFKPGTKPEDNLTSALRIHSLEKLGEKRFALIFSATDKSGDPIVAFSPSDVTVAVGATGQAARPAVIDRVTPLHMMAGWANDKCSFANIMDYSGSMFDHDLRAIESNYSSFISDLVLPFSASVIKFDHRVDEVLPLTENKTDLLSAIGRPGAYGGSTALYDAMDKGIAQVTARPHFRFVLVATDGNNNQGATSFTDVMARCRSQGISAFVLGFGWLDVNTLKQLANDSDGYYSYVPDSSDLKKWFPRFAKIVNNIQVLEFTTETSAIGLVELSVKAGGTTLKRTRPF
ncbi:MAG TPA: VWA domain-containing protein [Candidatus Ozemobacteraceae bacterium]|nr:VWA domain-containing protein [Candidatus Ozemobacteraceae bacterium]